MSTYDVEPYSVDNLATRLNRHSHGGGGYSEAKSHLSYLDEYFGTIGAKTILIESPYTDRDYLEDYAAYYARCHEEYGRRCVRLHFFSAAFDADLVKDAVDGGESSVEVLKSSYLGFIVVKPLPWTFIGRTCLVTYGNTGRNRDFPPARTYKVHIFGIELSVVSLPFQEQDKEVAACATSALWSVFNATGHIFQHHIPSPAEITKAATASQRLVNRTLPAGDGISSEQMADAIRSVGLEPLYVSAENLELLLISIRAYLRAKIPCLLVGAVMEVRPSETDKKLGLHAVALAGYDINDGPLYAYDPERPTLFAATGTTRLYGHDDQVGPFSRMKIDRTKPQRLSTSWRDGKGIRGNIFFKPEILLVPLYHKIRVPISSVISTVVAFDRWIDLVTKNGLIELSERIKWDVFLTEIAELKSSVYRDKDIPSGFRKSVLEDDLPRYIWRVSATSRQEKIFDILFDATDLLQGGQATSVLPYSKIISLGVAAIARNKRTASEMKATGNRGLEMVVKRFADVALRLDAEGA